MNDYAEKLLRLLVAETHCLDILIALREGRGKELREVSDEDLQQTETVLANFRLNYTQQLTPEGVEKLLTPLSPGPTKVQ